jgi:methyl-accepting chemotaxis protein
LREEEKKIVPALKRALNDDEVEAIARRLAAEKREERQGGNEQDATGQVIDVASRNVRAAADGMRGVAERGTDIARQGGEAAAQSSQRLAESVLSQAQQTSRSVMEAARTYGEMAHQAVEGMQALAGSTRISAEGARQVQQTWLALLNNTVRRSTETSQQLLRCSSPLQVAEVQRRFVDESLHEWFDRSAEMLRLSTRLLEAAAKPIEESARRFERGQP